MATIVCSFLLGCFSLTFFSNVLTLVAAVRAPQLLTGNFHYPHMGYREWHTNRFDPWGWRLYIVHTDPSGCGMFRFQEPQSHHKLQSGMGHIEGQQEQGSKPSPSPRQIHTRIDHDGSIRLFRVRGGQDALWHSICSEGGDRWSLGFAISDKAAQALLSMR